MAGLTELELDDSTGHPPKRLTQASLDAILPGPGERFALSNNGRRAARRDIVNLPKRLDQIEARPCGAARQPCTPPATGTSPAAGPGPAAAQ